MQYELIRKGIENRIDEIITGSEQRFYGELKDLICAYRELKVYIKDDPDYEFKRWLFGSVLIGTIKQEVRK